MTRMGKRIVRENIDWGKRKVRKRKEIIEEENIKRKVKESCNMVERHGKIIVKENIYRESEGKLEKNKMTGKNDR